MAEIVLRTGGLTFLSLSLIIPDRREETIEAWLLTHPEVEVVSRDRGGEYAAAARKGAPQAQQVADKFHLLLNLREKLKELMARKQKLLPHVETNTSDAIPDKARGALSACSPSPASLRRGEAEVFSADVSTAASRFLWLCPHPSRRNPIAGQSLQSVRSL